MKKLFPFFLIFSSLSFSEMVVHNQNSNLNNKIIKINKKVPVKKEIDNNSTEKKKEDCSFSNPFDCVVHKYEEVVENNKSISEVVFGDEEDEEVDNNEEDKSIYETVKEGVESGSASLWEGTKNVFKSAGSATSAYVKKKFDESWEESKREVARQKAEKRRKALERERERRK